MAFFTYLLFCEIFDVKHLFFFMYLGLLYAMQIWSTKNYDVSFPVKIFENGHFRKGPREIEIDHIAVHEFSFFLGAKQHFIVLPYVCMSVCVPSATTKKRDNTERFFKLDFFSFFSCAQSFYIHEQVSACHYHATFDLIFCD